MSIETWKAEFYPEEADIAAEKGALEATKHSLLKWEGLRKENKDKHGLGQGVGGGRVLVFGGESFRIDSGTCALCGFVGLKEESCESCPFYLANGFDCSGDLEEYDEEIEEYPYHSYTKTGDPEPMIECLEKTLEYLEENHGS